MREEYDFDSGVKNPYAKQLKKQVSINISKEAINYFKEEAKSIGIPYQTLINLYLTDCARGKKKLTLEWK